MSALELSYPFSLPADKEDAWLNVPVSLEDESDGIAAYSFHGALDDEGNDDALLFVSTVVYSYQWERLCRDSGHVPQCRPGTETFRSVVQLRQFLIDGDWNGLWQGKMEVRSTVRDMITAIVRHNELGK